uniref:Uncharacterized protein n=1 Tax=Meloidogyne enterolobii TaxID=390850 RepID=A0A6V7TSA3_MELEN|nr:unnamed protein product [Meloidogyne enterolobii]
MQFKFIKFNNRKHSTCMSESLVNNVSGKDRLKSTRRRQKGLNTREETIKTQAPLTR